MAVGTIPASTLQIGGTSTIDASGYFSDADGDELSYAGASSNEGVATVAMEGSSATITAVAAGDAVITITASDGAASVSQGFRIEVSSGPKQATVAIFNVESLTGVSVDPTNVSGNVNVVVNYEPNDETVVGIELLIGDYAMHCRGTTASGESDLAGSGGSQVEIPCLFETAKVMGECAGSQLAPMFANGEVELGARIHTQGGETRDALATQTVTLNNSNYVMVDHGAGSHRVLVGGVALYGGSSEAEGNMNAFHACPVAFDGTMVGTLALKALSTGPAKAQPHQENTALSFTAPTTTPAASFNGKPADRESADGFTWHANSAWNGMVEDRPGSGGREHWVSVDKIENADGLDMSADFETGMTDADGESGPWGPFYFDFKAPVPGTIQVGKGMDAADPDGEHYSAHKDNAIALSSVTDMGAGVDSTSITIAVGDGSADANKYDAKTKMPDRTMTPFDAEYASVTHISDLAEEDAVCTGKDDNGLDCYVAELTSLADKLGNKWSGGKTPASWLQTKAFGVDTTKPDLDDIEPDLTGLVFRQEPTMEFEVRNPDLASGDDGTDLTAVVKTGAKFADDAGMVTLPTTGIDATVDLAASVTAKEGPKSVRVTVSDGATPPNTDGYTFSFVYDKSEPTYSISETQGDINPGSATSVQVSVGGTVTDKYSNLETADLRLLIAPGGECFDGTRDDLEGFEELDADATDAEKAARDAVIPAPARLGGGKNPHKRELADGTAKSASLNSTFTMSPPDPSKPEMYCFRLDVEDVALAANGRASSTGNDHDFVVGQVFTVNWDDDTPDPGPTFEFFTPPAGAATALVAADSLRVVEGATTENVYWVKLKDAPTAASAYPLEMTIDGSATVTATIAAGVNSDGEFASATDSVSVTLVTAQDRNIVSELRTLTHKAKDFDDTDFPVRVLDNDFTITTDVMSIREDDDAVEVLVTVTAGSAQAADNPLSVTIGAPSAGPAVAADIAATSAGTAAVQIDQGETSDTVTVEIDAADDGAQDEVNEFIELSVSGSDPATVYYAPAQIMIIDDDPDIQLSLSVTEADEDAGNVAVRITATAKSEVGNQVNASIAIAGANGATTGAGDGTDDFTVTSPVALTIDAGETVGTATTTVTIVNDAEDDDGETIEFSAVNVTVGTKEYTFGSVKLTINDDDDTP